MRAASEADAGAEGGKRSNAARGPGERALRKRLAVLRLKREEGRASPLTAGRYVAGPENGEAGPDTADSKGQGGE